MQRKFYSVERITETDDLTTLMGAVKAAGGARSTHPATCVFESLFYSKSEAGHVIRRVLTLFD